MIRRGVFLIGLILAGIAGVSAVTSAQDVCPDQPPACEPGFQYVQEIEYREAEHAICKVVPIKKTKWVYSSKRDYFCLPRCPCFRHGCRDGCGTEGGCMECEGPYCRQQLVKKQV